MNILVTGGAGYIGSVVADKLVNSGHNVVVFDNLSKGHKEAIVHPGIELVIGDIRYEDLLGKIMKKRKIDAVMHFAAFIEAGESMKEPVKYFDNNSFGTLSLIKAMLNSHVGIMVFSSTAAVYGIPIKTPITENMSLNPINVYGKSKLMVEEMLSWINQIHGLKYAALRYFNASGATGILGEDHQPESHLIPIAIEAALGRRPKLYLFGTDYDTKDGTCIRDYIHVSDLADAHLLALNKLINNPGGGKLIYNLGNQNGFSNREVIDTVGKVAGKAVPVEEAERRPGDPPVLIASSQKIISELGWQAKYTDIEDIVRSAYFWREKNPRGYSA